MAKTKLESERIAAALAGGRAEYAARLVAGLGGNPQNYTYDGECFDADGPVGVCACGHEGIRYHFMLVHKISGDKIAVGSTCINHFALISPEFAERMAKDYVSMMDKLKEDLKRQKAEADKVEVKTLAEELEKVRDKADKIINEFREMTGKWYLPPAHYDVYLLYLKSETGRLTGRYKTASPMKKALKSYKEDLEKAMVLCGVEKKVALPLVY